MDADGSLKMYVETENKCSGRNDSYCLEMFSVEIENVKQDMTNLENLYNSLQESNEGMKNAQDSRTMRDVRVRLNTDLDDLFKLAKQINKKYDGLVRTNAAQRGSPDDQLRVSMISDLVDNLRLIMRKFQGLRTQMEADHRQLIEARFYAITRERATAEAIDNLIASEAAGSPLHHAIQELGRDPVAEAVAEIQERRDAMREIRRNLMALHQVLLGIATPVAAVQQQQAGEGGQGAGIGNRVGGDIASPAQKAPPLTAALGGGGKGGGIGALNDYERETRNQAYIAIAIALILVIILAIAVLKFDMRPDDKQ